MVYLFFGLPGCGKTTLLTKFSKQFVRQGFNVYGNVHLKVDGYTYIDNDCIGKYLLRDGKILVDEATLFANSRDYKNFSTALLQYVVQHRHFNIDLYFFSQRWNSLDLNIRTITDSVYYLYKPSVFGKWFTRYYRIPYGVIIPDPKKSDSQKLGEIIQGYCKPSFLQSLTQGGFLFRPLYYKYFDSWEIYDLPPLPDQYKPYSSGCS